MVREPENLWERYHAHVYFDETSVEVAERLCMEAWRACHVGLGRLHRKSVGPHPRWSCQLSFDADEFDRLIPWLEANRSGLSVLVHPLTGDDVLAEHSTHARWLGDPVALRLEVFEGLKQ